jgi:TRAP-type C4-dicarboxylate transport system permease small subunit
VKILEYGAKLCAVLAGLMLTVITLMICASLIGRNTIGWTLVGDIELAAAAAGAAVALFMPWCQFKRANIMVDFFTARAAQATQDRLDRVGALVLGLVMVLLTWRTAVGGLNAWNSQAVSMMLSFPEWIVYAFMVPALLLTAVIAIVQAVFGFEALQRSDPA